MRFSLGHYHDSILNCFIGSIDKLNHEMTSYETRHSSYGSPTGCMPGTRVKILEALEAWALDDLSSSKVYWLVGMAGTGKSTILHTMCEILDGKNMLGGSFFCSRGSENACNARLIVPTIAHSLASTSPCIKSEVIKAIENDPKLAEPTYIKLVDQFNKLIQHPIRASVGNAVKTYKILVIDAIDECTNLRLVSSLIQLILKSVSTIPLKVFIASRDEPLIRHAFTSLPTLHTTFYLHEVDKDVVKGDIRIFLEMSLAEIKVDVYHGHPLDTWPPESEISSLLDRSGRLFIYAATAIRYIAQGDQLYKFRLTAMANQDIKSSTSDIDNLYNHILDQACRSKEESEVIPMRQLVSMVVFLRNPLSIQAISSLSERDAHLYLSSLTSVIHIPTDEAAAVTIFHASFPDFLTDPTRCKRDPPFCVLVASEGHEMLALKCLEQMNCLLKYNICEVPKELTVSRRGTTNSPDNSRKIPEALKYSCIHWASHLNEALLPGDDLIDAFHTFLHEHLLHWIECLSELGELQTGISSLRSASTALSVSFHWHDEAEICTKCLTHFQRFKLANIRCHDLQLLADDGRQCLQMNFACIKRHSFEIYESALVWIPKKSLIRNVYATDIRRVPQVKIGLINMWGSMELHMQSYTPVSSVAFSQDGTRVASGSYFGLHIWSAMTGELEAELHMHWVTSVAFSQDGSRVVVGLRNNTVCIWNTMTGEIEVELKGHTDEVNSVAFSQDGSRVVSGSQDFTVRIWNTMKGEVETELKGHTKSVNSVVFAQDDVHVVSGSSDKTVRIWNTITGEVKVELKGYTDEVNSVVFAQDGSRVVSGLNDGTIRIWNMTTGEIDVDLKGHTGCVNSVAFSQDGSRVVSGSNDKTVRIWNMMTGEVEAELKNHTHLVTSVAFAQDGSQVVSGSEDTTVRIWNLMTDEVDTELKSHTDWVESVAFSQDGSQVVSGSRDNTVQIWNATTGEVEAKLKGHTSWVMSVAFSQDGSRVVSGSRDGTVRIWNTTTSEAEAELKGHTDWVMSVAFSQDGSSVVSGSHDNTARIWNITTGEVKAELKGHTNSVRSIAFTKDGSRVVSGSNDKTVRIWNMTTGEVEIELKGHTNVVRSVAFSQDGSQVVSGSHDKTVRIWNTVTGRSQLMTTTLVTLPDASIIQNAGEGDFRISYPDQLTLSIHGPLSISYDCQWIVGALHDCWIPTRIDFNKFSSSSFSGDRVCFGTSSGNVIIFDMKVAP